jgi:hypothetical protein
MRILFISILLNCFVVFGQNPSYKLFEEEIFPTAEKDYQKAKAIFIIYQNKYNFDPSNICNFLDYSLKNNDIKFFKKEITNLIKNYGFSYSSEDTSLSKFESSFYEGIYENHLHLWLMKTSQKYYPIWLAKHPLAIEYEKLLASMMSNEQLARGLTANLYLKFKNFEFADSNYQENYLFQIDSIHKAASIENIRKIAYAFYKNKKMITNFDHYSFGNIAYFIVSNNLKGKTNLDETWSRLHYYFEQAYIDGYDSGKFFKTYDYYLNLYQGLQYYGTLGEYIPFKDSETFKERKERLKL